MWDEPQKIAATLALVFTAIFFGWKLIAGWWIANLDLELNAERQNNDNTNDWLAVKLLLKKGGIDAIWLKDVALKIYEPENNTVHYTGSFEEFNSLLVENDRVNWEKPDPESRKYSIATNETFQFGKIISIPTSKPIMIEVAVFGKRIFWTKGPQWRASVGVLPVRDK